MIRPKISVIVPVYNVSEYIAECIQSLFMQTFRDFEIIVVDDCGTDQSIAIAEDILSKGKLPYQILHHDHNRGLSAGRNTGMAAANAEYVYFLDSDDYITPNCLSKLYEKAVESNADVTIGDFSVTGGRDIWLMHINPHRSSYFDGAYYVMAWNKLCKLSFLKDNKIAFIEGLVHEDEPWTFEVACKTSNIALIEDKTYIYRIRENSLQTGKDFTKHFNAYLTILQNFAEIIRSIELSSSSSLSLPGLLAWLERKKSLYFAQTLEKGTLSQQKQIYTVIRENLPQPSFTKLGIHYYLPKTLGIILYCKFHKYHLC